MFTPLFEVATALSSFVSGQLDLPSASRAWVSEQASHRCSSAAHDHGDKATAKRKAAPGVQSPRTIQIVSFGP